MRMPSSQHQIRSISPCRNAAAGVYSSRGAAAADQDRGQSGSACEVRDVPDGGGSHSARLVSGHPCQDTELGGCGARSVRMRYNMTSINAQKRGRRRSECARRPPKRSIPPPRSCETSHRKAKTTANRAVSSKRGSRVCTMGRGSFGYGPFGKCRIIDAS